MRLAHRAALTQSSPGYRKNVKMSFIIAHKPAHPVCGSLTGEDPFSELSDITKDLLEFDFIICFLFFIIILDSQEQ